jgi:hypothetical protein
MRGLQDFRERIFKFTESVELPAAKFLRYTWYFADALYVAGRDTVVPTQNEEGVWNIAC